MWVNSGLYLGSAFFYKLKEKFVHVRETQTVSLASLISIVFGFIRFSSVQFGDLLVQEQTQRIGKIPAARIDAERKKKRHLNHKMSE